MTLRQIPSISPLHYLQHVLSWPSAERGVVQRISMIHLSAVGNISISSTAVGTFICFGHVICLFHFMHKDSRFQSQNRFDPRFKPIEQEAKPRRLLLINN